MTDDVGFKLVDGSPVEVPPEALRSARQSKVDRIVTAVLAAGTKFWRDRGGNTYATVLEGSRFFQHAVRTKIFKTKVHRIFRGTACGTGKPALHPPSLSDAEMAEVISIFEAIALDGDVRLPGVRVVQYKGAIWLDLGDEEGRLIRITSEGWTPEDQADVPLIRSSGIEALPIPKSDPGALDNLRKLLNLKNEAELKCICAYLVTALFPDGPFPVLALSGEQGTGKSTVAKIVRRLVDPNKADLRGPPRNEEDLVLDAQHSRLIVFDNVSHINGEMADNLCRLASGGGFSKRKLYSDDDQIIISVVNPIILTGIPNLLPRADLADRAISITFQRIPIKNVRADSEIKAQFDLAAPGILALLLDGMVMALKHQLTVNIPHTPRMGDFVRRACGAASAFGWTEKEMFEALESNRRETSEAVIEENPVALALFDLAGQIGPRGLTGTAADWLTRLSRSVSEETAKDRCWPRGPRQFGDTLRRMTGPLRHLDVDVEWHREGGTGARLITIRKTRRMGEELPPKNDNRKSPTVTIKRKSKIVIITKVSSPASQTLEPPQPIPTTTSTVHGEDGGQ